MKNINDIIEEIIDEVTYRTNSGIVNFKNPKHITILSEVLTELGYGEVKDELIENITGSKPIQEADDKKKEKSKEDDKYVGVGGNPTVYVKKGEEDKYNSDPENFSGKKFNKDDTGKYVPVSNDDSDKNQKGGNDKETSTQSGGDNQDVDTDKNTSGEEEEEKAATKNMYSKDYDAPDLKQNNNQDGDDDESESNKRGGKSAMKSLDSEEIGKVLSKTEDTEAKNTMLDVGYGDFEKETSSKPAPGGAGSAFNEIVSNELVLALEKYPDMTEEELAEYSHKRFGDTALGKEQKNTRGVPTNPKIEERRKAAKGSGTFSKPEFPEQMKQVMQERAAYSKSRVSARSAIKKHEKTQERIKNLQSNNLLGKDTTTHPFYGADSSIDAQVDMVKNTTGKAYLPNGTEVDKDDLITFIEAGGGGLNPSDTAIFVTDENGNLLTQFISDKTTTADIQDNSTLSTEEGNYNGYIEKASLSEDDKESCKKINKQYSEQITNIEKNYNNQSKTIASNLLELDKEKVEKVIKDDTGTIEQNMNDAIYGAKSRKKGDFSKVGSKWSSYLPDGVAPEELSTYQKAEMIYKFAKDDNTLTNSIVKSINKVGLQYKDENPEVIGLDVSKILSNQRKEVVELQRERIRQMNNYTADVDGVSVGMGTLMEAEESIRGFHLDKMDYPPKEYVKGNIESIASTSVDVNMGGTVPTADVLRSCIGVNDTKEFKQKFKLVEEEELTYDSNNNVTGKKVYTYIVDGDNGKTEIGFKTYRSKTGTSGKTDNTMSYSTDMQKCFKAKSE